MDAEPGEAEGRGSVFYYRREMCTTHLQNDTPQKHCYRYKEFDFLGGKVEFGAKEAKLKLC